MKKTERHFCRKQIDDSELKRLWPSHMTDEALAQRLGHKRWVVRRRALKLGLPPRREIWNHQA